jgi:hypothetical protein
MKTLILTSALFLCSLSPPLLAADPAAQNLLITAKQQASLYHDQPNPFQLDVDFVAQVNTPPSGLITIWRYITNYSRSNRKTAFCQCFCSGLNPKRTDLMGIHRGY